VAGSLASRIAMPALKALAARSILFDWSRMIRGLYLRGFYCEADEGHIGTPV